MTPVHYFLALAYLDLKQEQPAIAEFEKVIHTPYVTPEVYNALASLYIRKKQFAEAEDLCRKAIALNPSRPDAYLNLARVYNAQHSSDKALEVLRGSVRGELELTDGLAAVVSRAPGVMGVLFEGRAYDNGTADAYLGSVAEYATRQRRV